MQHGLAKPQLGILRIDGQAVSTSPQRGRGVAEPLVGTCDERVELARDRIGRGRESQAALKERQSTLEIFPLVGNRSEVEQDERIVRTRFQLGAKDARVALQLAGAVPGRHSRYA